MFKVDVIQFVKISEEQFEEITGVMREIAIFTADEGDLLKKGLPLVVNRKDINIVRDIALSIDQTHMGSETGGNTLKTHSGGNAGICAGEIDVRGDPGGLETGH